MSSIISIYCCLAGGSGYLKRQAVLQMPGVALTHQPLCVKGGTDWRG